MPGEINIKGRSSFNPFGSSAGESNRQSRLTDEIVRTIRDRAKNGEKAEAIAGDYDITPTHCRSIIRRAAWKHVQ